MNSPNNCETCQHSRLKQGGHCYMFKDEPKSKCMQHTARLIRFGTIGHVDHGKTTLTAAIATVLASKMKDKND